MKTFLETNRNYSRSFMLYGNLNDTVWCGDLTIRTSEQFLVRLLKSRGYQHIIFYGEAGTKGAYCLDPESARFFFHENKNLPVLSGRDPTEEQDVADSNIGDVKTKCRLESPNGETNLGMLVGRNRRGRAYRPGDIPPSAINENTLSNQEEQDVILPQKVVYSRREMRLTNFYNLINPLMLEPKSNMAVIFYNIFTCNIGALPPLRDDILNVWEQLRGSDKVPNICLMMAPETAYDTSQLINHLITVGLASKFLIPDGSNGHILNPRTCFELGLPCEDEIGNLLRRLQIVGTESKHHKISMRYLEAKDIIAEILYCSRRYIGGLNENPGNYTAEYMRQIADRIEKYIDQFDESGLVEITPEVVDDIWGQSRRDRGSALEKLNVPGWEKAFEAVNRAVAQCEAYRVRHSGRKQLLRRPDWAVERLSIDSKKEGVRPPIPNFVLLGNPGVGKTTIARLIGQILRQHDILKVGTTVEVTKERLTSSFVAGIPKATMSCVERAEESVLFIDEAHSLGAKDGGADRDSTGKEVVTTLNNAMTDPNRHFSVILAGYEKDMKDVFRLDSGFASRFGKENFIVIDDYGPELLEKILIGAVEKNNCHMDPSLVELQCFDDANARPLECYLTRLFRERDRRTFGNARDMQNLALRLCAKSNDGVVHVEHFLGDEVSEEWFTPSNTGTSLERILDDIHNKYVGMEELADYFKAKAQEIEEKLTYGGSEDDIKLKPLVLVGEPGTGKTTVAECLARLYCHFNLLGTPNPIVVTGSSLASSYAGGVQNNVLTLIQEAQDRKGLLFVDEAHQLISDYFDGQGALKAFMNPLTDRKHPFMAVFAVYPSKLEQFLALDPGCESRLEILHMKSYTGPELFSILHKMMERHIPPLYTSEETDSLLIRVCEYIYISRTEQTGNARRMERLLDEMNALRRSRFSKMGIALGSDEANLFLPEDVPAYLVDELPPEDATPDQILSELDKLVGLQQVKDSVRDLISQVRINKMRRERGLPVPSMSLHMVFEGSPGTGKTTVARLIGRLYRSIGVLPRGQVVECGRGDLVAGYVGQTAIKTGEIVQKAYGGVLFVDEAYMLNSHTENDFGSEAIGTILKAMEDQRDNLVVIVAGYAEPMHEFLQSNPGLESRFTRYITFADYSESELEEILDFYCQKEHYTIEPEARTIIVEEIRHGREMPNFGNARFVRNLFEELIRTQARRVAQKDGELTERDLVTILKEDAWHVSHLRSER